jgi:hypothetical protein
MLISLRAAVTSTELPDFRYFGVAVRSAQRILACLRMSMWPKRIGGGAISAEVWPTAARNAACAWLPDC